jgi:hypothetical protein
MYYPSTSILATYQIAKKKKSRSPKTRFTKTLKKRDSCTFSQGYFGDKNEHK